MHYVWFEVFMVVTMKTTVVWVIIPCSSQRAAEPAACFCQFLASLTLWPWRLMWYARLNISLSMHCHKKLSHCTCMLFTHCAENLLTMEGSVCLSVCLFLLANSLADLDEIWTLKGGRQHYGLRWISGLGLLLIRSSILQKDALTPSHHTFWLCHHLTS
jgi:hypothetical protein